MTRSWLLATVSIALGTGLLGGVSMLVGCGERTDKGNKEWNSVKKETSEAWEATKAWGIARRADAEKSFSTSMDAMPQKLADAKAKAKAAGGDASKALDAKWDDVSKKLSELKSAGADKWESARDAFVKAYESLKGDLSKNP